ncbi:MAG: peptidylprolyl isomerase [Clostridia bacterium]|nr:peptidylprolyl isomerase [Clostridia bacterium]
MKRTISLILALLLSMGMLASCSEEASPAPSATPEIAITVGNQQVSANDYYRYMYSTRYSLLGSNTDELAFWESEKEKGVTYSDAATEEVQQRWIDLKLFAEEFDRLKLSFSAEEESAFNAALEQEINASGGMSNFRAQLTANHFTYEEYKTSLYDAMKKDRVLLHYFGEGGEKAVPMEELKAYYNENNARIKMILLSKVDSYYNEPLEESEIKTKRETMEDAYAAAQRKTDPTYFDELISIYSEDATTRGKGAIYSKGDESEMAKKAFALEIGEITTFENEVGFYVIQRFDGTTEDVFTEKTVLQVIEVYCAEQIDALLSEWRAAAKITVDEAVVELYRPENLIGQ